MSFPTLTDTTGPSNVVNQTRLKRQLIDQAIAAATAADWNQAVEINKRILEMGADLQAENRLAKAYWELGELGTAREHYQIALGLDPFNRIAERNIERLRVLLAEAGTDRTVAAQEGSKAPVNIYVEETGKTGFAHLYELPKARLLAQVNPGDAVELLPDGNRLAARSNGMHIGFVDPRVAARLLKLMEDGNKYLAGVTSIGDKDVRVIIREIYQDPRNFGKVSFPTAAKVGDLRPYTKGTLIREEIDLEDEMEMELDEDDVLGDDTPRIVPADVTDDEAFEAEADSEDDN